MSTPFLLCLKDMDRLGAYLNNVTNELICGDKRIPIIKADAPRRFKFTLKDNCDFNYELIVDRREALKLCWIDTYLGPPDVITHDAVPVEAHWSIASAESLLQMAFKSVNDTAGPDGLVPTLLVFEVTVELNNGPAKFRSTAVQPYFRHPDSQQQRSHDVLQQPHADNQTADNQADSINVETEAGVIVPERYDMNKHGKHRLFKSRMVREVKGYGDDEQINVTTAETNADTALQVNAFGVAALQTDDTLLPKKTLREGDTCDFNGSLIALEKGYLLVMQKGLEAAKVFVFTDGSFANNKDLSSQIGFVIIIATETNSTKCKRVTRSVLASEIYGLASGFDLAYVVAGTINQITSRLGLPQIPLVAYEQREITNIRWINGRITRPMQ
ncbi:uncharacterized protein HRG_02767 [Hirsutella rhossiliensis]|uniref:Uncharacterized protein n=1 Tax=Hirsutella rhossiliensis TaxID=111463 RepID=A0A9P8N2Z9_9HYPO|nr:uncharacterized protein HRG_02767 [Hirsutella rhossiliensis]KAH0967358.1 hypothetical protein HRG_02767 [Hirsutella rhossiliensis]